MQLTISVASKGVTNATNSRFYTLHIFPSSEHCYIALVALQTSAKYHVHHKCPNHSSWPYDLIILIQIVAVTCIQLHQYTNGYTDVVQSLLR